MIHPALHFTLAALELSAQSASLTIYRLAPPHPYAGIGRPYWGNPF